MRFTFKKCTPIYLGKSNSKEKVFTGRCSFWKHKCKKETDNSGRRLGTTHEKIRTPILSSIWENNMLSNRKIATWVFCLWSTRERYISTSEALNWISVILILLLHQPRFQRCPAPLTYPALHPVHSWIVGETHSLSYESSVQRWW